LVAVSTEEQHVGRVRKGERILSVRFTEGDPDAERRLCALAIGIFEVDSRFGGPPEFPSGQSP
jgi:hypothetical protein